MTFGLMCLGQLWRPHDVRLNPTSFLLPERVPLQVRLDAIRPSGRVAFFLAGVIGCLVFMGKRYVFDNNKKTVIEGGNYCDATN